MSFQSNNDSAACRSIEPLLSEYQENALSARQVWEVEKHLTACATCTQLSQQMQATVQALRSADRYDTGDGFMAKLHARLDNLEPEPARRRSLREVVQDGISSMQTGMRTWHLPALTAGFAAAVLMLMVHGNMSVVPPKTEVKAPGLTTTAGQDLSRQVAFSASNPFDDPVAAKAEVDGANALAENRTDNSGMTVNF